MTHKLLLADDSVTIQRVVELTFSGEDVQVVTVGDGEQAIARIPGERPDVVLVDIGMPKRSGYEVAAFVKGRPDLAHIPVLLLAGAFEPVDEERARQVGSDGVFVKPFEPQQLVSRVKELIEAARNGVPPARPSEPSGADVKAWRTEPAFDPSNTDTRLLESRAVNPESRIANPESRPADPDALRLDDYFERLDAAFAELGSDTDRRLSPPSRDFDEFEGREVPTLEGLLGSSSTRGLEGSPIDSEVPAFPAEHYPQGAATDGRLADTGRPLEGRNLVADMFAALFALEESEAGAPPVQIQPPRPEAAVISDAMVDEITRRVMERLASNTAPELVSRVVADVAERLIREEIARIKAGVAARLSGIGEF